MRLALGVSLALTLGEVQGLPFAFMAAVFTLQVLTKQAHPPTLKQGLGFAVVMVVAANVTLALCSVLLHRPVAYLLVLSLVFFACFYLMARGKGAPLPQLLLICNAALPLLAVQSADFAADFAGIMIIGAVIAPLTAWLVHALLPEGPGCAAIPTASPISTADDATGRALLATLVLMLPFVYFMLQAEEASIVVAMTCIGIMSQAPDVHSRTIAALLMANLIGGIAASLAYLVITLLPIPAMLFLMTLLTALVLAARLYAPTPMAPVFGIALTTFLIVFGLGLVPIGEGSTATFAARIIDVALTSLYTIGAVALFSGAKPLPSSSALSMP